MVDHDTATRRPIPDGYRCLGCDYSLGRLETNRCPECGRPFDPSDLTTMSTAGVAFPGWARWLQRPPGPVLMCLGLFPILFSAWEFRRPGGDFNAQVGGFLLWVLCGAVWGARVAALLAVGMFYRRPGSEGRSGVWRWAILPCLFVLWIVVLCSSSDLLLHGAFSLSRDDLRALALRGSVAPQGQRAGVLWVERVDRIQDGILLMTGTGYDACPYGYAWFPKGKPQDTADLRFHEFDGPWYTFWAQSRGYASTPSLATQPTVQPPL